MISVTFTFTLLLVIILSGYPCFGSAEPTESLSTQEAITITTQNPVSVVESLNNSIDAAGTSSENVSDSVTPSSEKKEQQDKEENDSSNLKLTENVKNETEPIAPEWGGNCTETNWIGCSSLKTYFGAYVDPKDPTKTVKHHEIDCKIQPILCLKNGWTVTRCQILCMGRCNRG
jgi:hypothetical protein